MLAARYRANSEELWAIQWRWGSYKCIGKVKDNSRGKVTGKGVVKRKGKSKCRGKGKDRGKVQVQYSVMASRTANQARSKYLDAVFVCLFPVQQRPVGQGLLIHEVYRSHTAPHHRGPLACWDCGFESQRGHGCLSVVDVVCCQVEVSRTSCRRPTP